MDTLGFEPTTSRMRSVRATPVPRAHISSSRKLPANRGPTPATARQRRKTAEATTKAEPRKEDERDNHPKESIGRKTREKNNRRGSPSNYFTLSVSV